MTMAGCWTTDLSADQKARNESMNDLQYITLRGRPELKDAAASWFHSKWGVPKEAA